MRAECICPIVAEIKLPIIGNRFSLPMQNNQLEFSFDHFQKNKVFHSESNDEICQELICW